MDTDGNTMYTTDASLCYCVKYQRSHNLSSFPDIGYQTIDFQLAWNKTDYLDSNITFDDMKEVSIFNPIQQKLERAIQPRECTIPERTNEEEGRRSSAFEVINKTSSTLEIALPNLHIKRSCSNIQSEIIYSVFYQMIETDSKGMKDGENMDQNDDKETVMDNKGHLDKEIGLQQDDEDGKIHLKRFGVIPGSYQRKEASSLTGFIHARSIILSDLKAFSNYTIHISARNAYGQLKLSDEGQEKERETEIELVARTGEGKPSPPRNVFVTVLSPESAIINWLPSLAKNSDHVKYIVKWSSISGVITFPVSL
jgi:hypothetical protein